MANTNLFQKGDYVTTKYGQGIVIKNCAKFEFWEVNISEVGIKEIHYKEINL
ncbi:hypothetical protein [Desulfosporosinus nitroreducens]|uniref:hypothetical protein n=1 Tax=Desulfosporosinus nitroreducens TaxID=2018668 RepID=UPI00207D6FC1|nr:hypothetical protein [Desulfosporosinus nitroreducens]MCO1599869.1 hypothetical protein [Desulfosporosinus nitroreducens]